MNRLAESTSEQRQRCITFSTNTRERVPRVIVISSDLPEILDVSDRIYVMREGQITAELSRLEATEEKVMRFASLAPQEIS